ncbi:MAG: hypothetical protein R2791_03865 [Saprospiraceae bacterium]|nr:hypothetical protein [Saprospiraceae bacterium]MCB0542836.1 hypothetical protein [Saprospiraceae bacterium]MCB9355701.1 hypothetical protein [Lewinellaceae bacterium]
MEMLLELLKYTIPGLVVFATAYYLLKLYLDDRLRTELAAQRSESMKITLPLRLQAYERLILLCDRVSIQNALLRIRMPGMTVGDLRGALLLAISQEFDHNTSQQLYVSDTLWKIITFARNETLSTVGETEPGLDPKADAGELVAALFRVLEEKGDSSPLQKAMVAIRTEAGQLF